MNVIITMAGDGTRFRNIGSSCPKHMISVRGRTLFEWALESLRNFFSYNFIFIARAEHNSREFIAEHCSALGIANFTVIEIGQLNGGQAESVLVAESALDPSTPILIYNIDTYVEPQTLSPKQIRGDGWLPVFEAEGDKWSFAQFDSCGLVSKVTEKIRISDFGTIGLYYFSSFSLFKSCYENYDFASYRERYIAPLYDYLLQTKKVYAEIVPSQCVHALGTPEDVMQFAPEFSFATIGENAA